MASPTFPSQMMSLDFTKAYVITMRPYLLFVSGITGITGLAFAPGISPWITLLIAIAGFLAYGFGQALTDCTQTDTDSISSPYRPLVQGRIKKNHVVIVSLLGLAMIGAVYLWREPRTIFLTLAGTMGLASYTWFKRRWWGGPFWNSWIVVVLALVSYFAASGTTEFVSLPKGFIVSLLAIFFGYANFVLSGYYKDIEADRATGYHTVPVRFGYKVSNIISDAFAALACSSTLIVLLIGNNKDFLSALPSLLVFLIAFRMTLLAQLRLHRVRHDEEAHKAIAPVVNTYILQLTAIALSIKPSWWWILALYYIAYELTMKLRPLKAQI
ncbi:MAG: UbiA family prenyltransferase [Candidatus Kapaibacterium sp.]